MNNLDESHPNDAVYCLYDLGHSGPWRSTRAAVGLSNRQVYLLSSTPTYAYLNMGGWTGSGALQSQVPPLSYALAHANLIRGLAIADSQLVPASCAGLRLIRREDVVVHCGRTFYSPRSCVCDCPARNESCIAPIRACCQATPLVQELEPTTNARAAAVKPAIRACAYGLLYAHTSLSTRAHGAEPLI